MFKSFPIKSVPIAVLVLTVCAAASISVARAAPIIVGSEADFLAAVGDVEREGFEAFPTDLCSTGGSSPSTSISTSLLTVTTSPQAGGTSFLCIGTTAAGFPGPTEGSNALIAGSNTGDPWILSFVLTEAVNGVYFELTDAVERGDAFISIEGMANILVANQGSGGLNTVFFGIIMDAPFTQFSLINTGVADGWGVDNMIFAQVSEQVTIDIKPGSDPNSINPASRQKIPIAILTTDTFLAFNEVDPLSVEFGPDGATESHERGHVEDVDGDGDMDLLFHFDTQATGIACSDTEATLTGETFGGVLITGTDSINTVPCR